MSKIMGMTHFYYTDNQKFIVANDDTTKTDMLVFDPGPGTFTPQGLNLTKDYKFEFATYLDGLFCVNYADATMFYNGTTWSTSTNVTNAPKSKYIIPYGDKLYLLNIDVSGTKHPSRVAMSSLPDPDAYTITWDMGSTGNYFDIKPKDGDEIKGGAVNSNRLLIYKENSVWRYDTNTLVEISGLPGTNNHRSIQTLMGWTIHFHQSGIYGVNGSEYQKLSRDIQPIIDGVNSLSLDKLCSYVDGDNYCLYLGDISNTLENISIENCVVKLNMTSNIWTVETMQDVPTVFSQYRDDRADLTYDDETIEYDYYDKNYDATMSAKDYIFFGTEDGGVFKLNDEVNTQNTYKIRSYAETWNHYPNGVHGLFQAHALKFYMDNATRVKLAYSIDDEPWKPIIRYVSKPGYIYYQFKSGIIGNRIRFRISDNSTGERVKIYGIDVFYTPQANLV